MSKSELTQAKGFTRKYVKDSLVGAGALKGEKGDVGEKGDKGDRGEKGEKGEKGDSGEVVGISISSVKGLSTALESLASQSYVEDELSSIQQSVINNSVSIENSNINIENLTQTIENLDDELDSLSNDVEGNNSQILTLNNKISSIDGQLTFLPPKDFGETPTQQELTNYAKTYEIEPLQNSLTIKNLYNNTEWIYNKSNSTWVEYGNSDVSIATKTTLGIVKVGLGININAEGEISLNKTGIATLNTDQSIGGVKMFLNSPQVPSPTDGADAVPKSYVDAKKDKRITLEIENGDSLDLRENTDYTSRGVAISNLSIVTYPTSNEETTILFNSGDIATSLSLPDFIKWANGIAINIKPNKMYLISIQYGLWIWGEF